MGLPLGEIGAERLVQPVAAGFGPPLGFRIVLPPAGHGQDYTGDLRGEMLGQACMGFAAMAGSARHGEATVPASLRLSNRHYRRRSSVVEHVIGNDGVSSSILLGGTSISKGLRGISGFQEIGLLTNC